MRPGRLDRALLATGLLAACGGAADRPVRVGAAASLGEVLPPLLEVFQEETGMVVHAAYGGSGALAVQARHGAPFDALILAGEAPMDRLEAARRLRPGTRRNLAANRLVLAATADRAPPAAADTLAGFLAPWQGERIAIGGQGVPAGDYARRWLARSGLTRTGRPGGVQFVEFDHVRAVLAALESGACAAGFVYATDAQRPGLRVVLEADPGLTGPIRYPMAVLAGAARPAGAGRLLAFLASRTTALAAAGFLPDGTGD